MLRARENPIVKTEREIEKMRVSGRMVADVLAVLAAMIKPGVTTAALRMGVPSGISKPSGLPA